MDQHHPYRSPTRIKGYRRSVVLGGGKVLHPIADAETARTFADTLQKLVREAEVRAFDAGVRYAQARMRRALGAAQ